MTDRSIWAGRVKEWRLSGFSARVFCEGKPYRVSGLRYWTYRLKREAEVGIQERVIRIQRVDRAPMETMKQSDKGASAIRVEVFGASVGIHPGFDPKTLSAVFDVLSARGGAR